MSVKFNLSVRRLIERLETFEEDYNNSLINNYSFIENEIDGEKLKEWIVEELEVELVSLYGDNEIIEEITTIHL